MCCCDTNISFLYYHTDITIISVAWKYLLLTILKIYKQILTLTERYNKLTGMFSLILENYIIRDLIVSRSVWNQEYLSHLLTLSSSSDLAAGGSFFLSMVAELILLLVPAEKESSIFSQALLLLLKLKTANSNVQDQERHQFTLMSFRL